MLQYSLCYFVISTIQQIHRFNLVTEGLVLGKSRPPPKEVGDIFYEVGSRNFIRIQMKPEQGDKRYE